MSFLDFFYFLVLGVAHMWVPSTQVLRQADHEFKGSLGTTVKPQVGEAAACPMGCVAEADCRDRRRRVELRAFRQDGPQGVTAEPWAGTTGKPRGRQVKPRSCYLFSVRMKAQEPPDPPRNDLLGNVPIFYPTPFLRQPEKGSAQRSEPQ